MRLTAQGWARDHGPTEIVDIDLTATEAKEGSFTHYKNKPVLGLERSPLSKSIRRVVLNCFAKLRLGGDYQVKISLSKSEIAHLFYADRSYAILNIELARVG